METQDFTGKYLLIVDDDALVRETLAEQLALRGALVAEASNGNKAFELLQEREFDAVISDVRMDQGSGIDLLKQIKSSDKKMPPVIMISAFEEIEAEDLKDLGAKHFLLKSSGIQKIETVLKQVLKGA